MKSKSILVATLVVAFALLAVVTALAATGGVDDPSLQFVANPVTSGVPDLDKLPAGVGAPGVYVSRDWRYVDPSVYPVVGGQNTFDWIDLEPADGVYDWAPIDTFIATQTALGKKAAFGISTYGGRIENGLRVPAWLVTTYPHSVIACGGGVTLPRYWDADYLAKFGAFVDALGARYKNNANVAFVQIGVGLYGEVQPGDDADDQCVKNAMVADFGFTPGDNATASAKWVQTVNTITDRWGAAFSGGSTRLFLIFTPRFVDICEKRDETLHASTVYSTGIFAGGIEPDQLTVFSNPPGGLGCQKWDPYIFWNNVTTRTIPMGMETYRYMLPTYDTFYWGVLSALNKHIDYLSLEADLLYTNHPANPIAENLALLPFANQYLGKTAATAPSAWVALRETSVAHNGMGCNMSYNYPQRGNYDYYLNQDDTVAGGRTITASSTMTYVVQDANCGAIGTVLPNPQYDPKLAGAGAQGWVTRRTDHTSGNDYMYFRVDPSFVSGQGITSSVFVTVTYLDSGMYGWYLQYKKADGSEEPKLVFTNNSGLWKTVQFKIDNMSFTNTYANGNNFRIYNGGSNDLFVHMVMVGKPKPAGPTPTPTQTRTPTVTATPMPHTVVFQKGVSPTSFYSGVADTYISQYNPEASYGLSPTIELRSNDVEAALLRFDLSAMPQSASIVSATFSIHVDYASNSYSMPVNLYGMIKPWSDMQATWISATNSVAWTVAGANSGGDRMITPADSVLMAQANTWYNLNVTDLVRQWVLNPASNKGMILKAGTAPNVGYGLRSSDYSSAPDYRPKLTITCYNCQPQIGYRIMLPVIVSVSGM